MLDKKVKRNGPPRSFSYEELERTEGTATGEEEHAIVPGGWLGTDDATSTAPSDVPNDNPDENPSDEEHAVRKAESIESLAKDAEER